MENIDPVPAVICLEMTGDGLVIVLRYGLLPIRADRLFFAMDRDGRLERRSRVHRGTMWSEHAEVLGECDVSIADDEWRLSISRAVLGAGASQSARECANGLDERLSVDGARCEVMDDMDRLAIDAIPPLSAFYFELHLPSP